MPFTLGGSPLAHIGGGVPFAYRGSQPIYIGTTPMVISSDDFPLIPLVPPPIIPPVSMPPGHHTRMRRRLRRKMRMRHGDQEIEADTAAELAEKLRALLLAEGAEGDVPSLLEAAGEIHIDLSGLAPYLDLDDDEEDDEVAVIHAIMEILDL